MANPLGTNASEFLSAIRVAKRIYDTFFDEFDEAPARVQELLSTVKYLSDILQESEALLASCNRTFPGQDTFTRKLEECDQFIRKRCTRVPESSEIGSPVRVRKIWHTPSSAFEDQEAQRINDGLQVEMQKLVLFILTLALQANITAPSARARVHYSISGHLPPRSSNIEDIVGRINEICYHAQRRQIQAIQLNREVDISDLYSQLQNEWQVLCLRAGFVQRGRVPGLPWDENLLLAPNRNLYHDAIVNLTNDTVHTPLNDRRDAARLIQQSTPQRIAVDSPGSPISRAEPERNQVILGDPALPVCVASFMIGDKGLRLQHWRIERAAIGRIVVWTGTDPVHTLIHYVPANAMPYTKHRSLKSTEKYNVISFHQDHRVVWNKSGQNRLDKQMPVIYHFVDAKDLKRFQEELRDKDLLDTFDTDTVKSKRPTGRYGEAGNQDMKLWCSRDEGQVYTISFYANHTENEHLEFPIKWFQDDISADPKKRTVQLVFAPPTETSAPFALPARPSSFMRKFSFARSESSQTVSSSAVSITSSSSKASISTLNSIMSALEGMGGHVEPFAPAEVSKVFQYLHITFSESEGPLKRPGESDFDRFVTLFAKAHQLSHYLLNPSTLRVSPGSEDRAVGGGEASQEFYSGLPSISPMTNIDPDVQMEDV